MAIEIKLPDLGDGIDSGDVLEVLVSEGDVIEKEQGIVELETDKATVEVPSSHAGQVAKVHVQPGQTVKIGEALISLEATAAETPPAPAAPPPPAPEPPAPTPEPAAAPPAEAAAPSEPQKVATPTPTPVPAAPTTPAASAAPKPPPATAAPAAPAPSARPEPHEVIPAGPAIRRFAREVGVDLSRVNGSGDGGRITRDDVLAAVRSASKGAAAQEDADAQSDDWGVVRIEKLPKIRRTIASKMVESWSTVPRVTNYDDADVTELERIRQASKADYAEKGIKLTAMPFLIKAVAMALREHPAINASLAEDGEHVIYKQYVNVGIAVDTDRGLVVPSLRSADTLSISEIARELARLADTVREGTFKIEDLRGSTFTISNLGAIGGTYSTPIINVPEVAILLVGRSRKMPVVVDDEIAVRLMMPLSLSYDHRLVDGAAAARFLNEVIEFLSAPSRLLLAP